MDDVILAHALLIFAAEPRCHLKSAQPWLTASVLYEFMRITTMPLFFVLAGWSRPYARASPSVFCWNG